MTSTATENEVDLKTAWWRGEDYQSGELWLPGQSRLDAAAQELLEEIGAAAHKNELDIPALPEAALEASRMMKDPDVEIEDIAAVIERDAMMTAQVLRFANSPLFGARCPIDHMQHAVSHLGMKRLKSVLLEIAMKRVSDASPAKKFAVMEWRYSASCALICRAIAKRFKFDTELCYLAGLLHDIGRMPVIAALHARGHAQGAPEEDSSVEIIIECLHRGVGMQVAKDWDLPPAVADAIGVHLTGRMADEPSQAKFPSTKVAEAAGDLCFAIGMGRFRKPYDILSCPSLLDIGFDQASLQDFLKNDLPKVLGGHEDAEED